MEKNRSGRRKTETAEIRFFKACPWTYDYRPSMQYDNTQSITNVFQKKEPRTTITSGIITT
jgi:hypothetical protein